MAILRLPVHVSEPGHAGFSARTQAPNSAAVTMDVFFFFFFFFFTKLGYEWFLSNDYDIFMFR